MKKILLIMTVLMIMLNTGCHKKEKPQPDPIVDPVEPVDPVKPDEPINDPDPVIDDKKEQPLTLDELLEILSSYNMYESMEETFITFYKDGNKWLYKTGTMRGKNIREYQINDMYYDEEYYHILSTSTDNYESSGIDMMFEDKMILSFDCLIEMENYSFVYSTKEVPTDEGLSDEQLLAGLGYYSSYENEDGFFVQFYTNNNESYYSEGIWSSGYTTYGTITDIAYKGNDTYIILVLFPEIAEGVDNEYVPEHLEDIRVTILDEKMLTIKVVSDDIERELTGVVNSEMNDIFTELSSFDCFSCDDKDFTISFFSEMGNCFYYESDNEKGEYKTAIINQIIPMEDNSYKMYLSFEENDFNVAYDDVFTIYYALQEPSVLKIQYPDRLDCFTAQQNYNQD